MTDTLTPPAAESSPKVAETDRGISPIGGRFGVGKTGKIVTITALGVGCAIFLAATWRHGPPKPKPQPVEPARQIVSFEPAATPAPPTLEHPGADAPRLTASPPEVPALQTQGGAVSPAPAPAVTRAAQVQAIRSAPILAFSQGGSQLRMPTVVAAAEGLASATGEGAATELDQLRRGSAIGLARAGRLPNRLFLITAGTSIPCTLLTAMDTATPGYVTCVIPTDVYSDNGAVVLLEKGTKVLGEYRSGMKQGQRRLFVLWTRAVTPAGVAIGLASPASDALGRAGFDGTIDTHFWERFGGALLLSIVDDTAAGIASRTDPNGSTVRVPSDAAAVALQNSINIPPSLTKAQGSEVAIFAAQDFDFSSVYGLKAR